MRPDISTAPPFQSQLDGLVSSAASTAAKFWNSVRRSIVDRTAAVHSSHGVDYDSVNLSKAVFVATFVAIMAGCGLVSALHLRNSTHLSKSKRRRRSRPDGFSDNSQGITSSEEEGCDSKGSLRHGTKAVEKVEEVDHEAKRRSTDAYETDPSLLKKHSSYVSYTTSVATYPSIRTFYYPHPHMAKLPSSPAPIPLLVFVHGLGGSLAQFHRLLTSLSNVGPCFGIDFPGCGLSDFSPTSWDAYTVEALAELLATAVEKYRESGNGQGVILIAHSLGCSISALLGSANSNIGFLKDYILGLVAVCPKALPPNPQETAWLRRALYIPDLLFDLWRLWDRRGGVKSPSVLRFIGEDVDSDTRVLQVRFNRQSRTPVWRRMAWGSLPKYVDENAIGGIPGEPVWAGIQVPVFLVAGESDAVTTPAEVKKILAFFRCAKDDAGTKLSGGNIIPDASRVQTQIPAHYDRVRESDQGADVSSDTFVDLKPHNVGSEKTPKRLDLQKKRRVVKSSILPAPASHALLYQHATYRILAGIVQDFLRQQIDERLDLGWQLQYLNTSGKWDMKNLAKWKKVAPVSYPIGDTFAALKMLREVDEDHNPVSFSEKYRGKIYAVIDISHENPVYNPSELEKGGIHYYKFPTVSKVPPTPDETRDFIALVDGLQKEIDQKMEEAGNVSGARPLVGVHCHYGFNRTGFLIVSYLIERRGFRVQAAIDEFETRRPPGIRHAHFIDTLFVRYCVGLTSRAPTL